MPIDILQNLHDANPVIQHPFTTESGKVMRGISSSLSVVELLTTVFQKTNIDNFSEDLPISVFNGLITGVIEFDDAGLNGDGGDGFAVSVASAHTKTCPIMSEKLVSHLVAARLVVSGSYCRARLR